MFFNLKYGVFGNYLTRQLNNATIFISNGQYLFSTFSSPFAIRSPTMELNKTLTTATTIANLLMRESARLGACAVRDLPLMGTLSIISAAKTGDFAAFDPKIKEIILFGSTARGENDPGDIDLMVFDNGFYSNVIGFEPGEQNDGENYSSWGGQLQENLTAILEGWFGYGGSNVRQFDDVLVDLQILPIAILTDPVKRGEVSKKHFDPRFFENAFSTILRFDESETKFVPTTLEELEQKYQQSAALESFETG
jgi:hypothetical protein